MVEMEIERDILEMFFFSFEVRFIFVYEDGKFGVN